MLYSPLQNIAATLRMLMLLTLMVLAASAAQACPSCKEALGSSDAAQGDVVGAYFWSILFMLTMPFTLISCFSFTMWRAVKRANAEKAAAEAGSAATDALSNSAMARPEMTHV